MDALELAMEMEQHGESFYRDLAAKATNPFFREIFYQLANDEIQHYQIFKNMQQAPKLMVDLPLVNKAGNIFKQMIAHNQFENLDQSQLELYQKAMELEKKSREFYLEKAAESKDKDQVKILQKIAAEEENHYFLLHNIYELVMLPQTWVENGEFVHLEDYRSN